MAHDVRAIITEAELSGLYWADRLNYYAVVDRVACSQLGGGCGDQHKHPYAWTVLVYVDNYPAREISARGGIREWTGLDRLQRWLRAQGFRYWWVQIELKPVEFAIAHEPESLGPPTSDRVSRTLQRPWAPARK